MHKNSIWLGLMLMSAGLGSNCKSKTDARVKSVEALEQRSSAVARNQTCSGSYSNVGKDEYLGTLVHNLDKVSPAKVNESIKIGLNAAPKLAVDAFRGLKPKTGYVAIHGSYDPTWCQDQSRELDANSKTNVITNDAKNGPASPAACWGIDQQGRHVINVFADPNIDDEAASKIVHNYLLVELGFMFDAYMVWLGDRIKDNSFVENALASGAKEQVKKHAEDYQAKRKTLVDAIIEDLKAKKEEFKPAEEEIQNLSPMLFAEAFDAYYCNTGKEGTREQFKEHLPKGFAAFEGLANNFFK